MFDQSGAPSPDAAGWVLMDLMDGNLDGDIDIQWAIRIDQEKSRHLDSRGSNTWN